MVIKPFHIHLAEIYEKYESNKMTSKDYTNLFISLKQNQLYVLSMIKLNELSYLAHETDDYDWQHEICARLDALIHDPKAVEA